MDATGEGNPRVGVRPLNMTRQANFEVWSGFETVFSINHNNGQFFEFHRIKDQETWVTTEALERSEVKKPSGMLVFAVSPASG